MSNVNSIIFSCWTRTLHLLSKHLDKARIPHLRIDGGCPPSQRQAKLEQFAKDDEKRVLIMTTGTGGFGYVSCLGCSLGTQAYVVLTSSQAEPDLRQPRLHHRAAVEPRRGEPGHRTRHPTGAGNEVYVTRYVIKDTVEEVCSPVTLAISRLVLIRCRK